MVGLGPNKLAFRWVPALGGDFHSSYFSSFLLNAIFVDFLRFCRFWGICWQAKWKPKSIFATFFPTFFSSAFRDRIFVVFWKRRTSKIMLSPRREHDFHKIDVFEKYRKKARFRLHFRRSKRRKIKKQWCWKTCLFWVSYFMYLFANFSDFGSILGGPGGSKNCWKS